MSQPPSGAPAATRGRRDAAMLAAGSTIAGVLAYVFFALVIRALGAGPSAPVAVLWAWWGFAGAALTFPVQHWIARTAATAAGEASVRRGLASVSVAVLGVSMLAGGSAWLARERLFGPEGAWFPVLVLLVGLGSGLLGLLRGLQSARRRFGAVAAGLVVENGIRCLAAVVLVLAGNDTPAFYGLALLAGYAVAGLWPRALLPLAHGQGDAAGPMLFVSGASAGQLLAQVTLTGGPVLLAAIGGAPAEVTALFAGLALFRAPYTLALGVVAAVTGRLTALVERRRWATLTRIRRIGGAVTLVTAAVGGFAGAWLGPPAMELVFGDGVRLTPGDAAIIAVGTVIAMANLVLTLGLLARNRAAGVVTAWMVAAPFGGAGHLLLGDTALSSTCWTFMVVETVAFAVLVGWESRSDRLVSRQEDRGADR